MTWNALVWITARDGSIHATRPPILADGQRTLCARSYDRLDLRVRGNGSAGACPICSDEARLVLEHSELVPEGGYPRKAPLWP